MTPQPAEAMGLRERKKIQTRNTIQDHALRLFDEQGYAETTTEQIAAAAGISPSTFFRYFPTKEETVLYDRVDPRLIDSFLAQPPELSAFAAIRAAFRETFGQLAAAESERELVRQRLVFAIPELRTQILQQLGVAAGLLTDGLAQRLGREPDAEIRTWTGAVLGVMLSAFFELVSDDSGDPEASIITAAFIDRVNEALRQLEAGFDF